MTETNITLQSNFPLIKKKNKKASGSDVGWHNHRQVDGMAEVQRSGNKEHV